MKPSAADESLWVRLAGHTSVWLIDGNPHTHQGRMRALEPRTADSTYFSLSEVTDASERARAWIQGYLAGSEPEAVAMFGIGILDADEDDPRWERWRSALAEYRRTGDWPHLPWEHLLRIPDGGDLPPYLWTVRGDEVWQWNGGSWVLADPQPSREFKMLEGTVCHELGVHSMVVKTTAHLICERCGLVTQVLPAGMTDEEFERQKFTYEPKNVPDE